MEKIIISEPEYYPDNALDMLQGLGCVVKGPFSRQNFLDECREATILIVRLGHSIDSELVNSAPNLKAIVSATTGLNHIDQNAVKKGGIELLSLRGEKEFLESISPTAELTFGLILDLVRHISRSIESVKKLEWKREKFMGRDLHSLSLGIYGYGRVGRKVSRIAKAFGMKVYAYDVDEKTYEDGVIAVNSDELLSMSDIVSLHTLHNDNNDKHFDGKNFSQMKKGSYFINTARGELVDEAELLKSLQTGHILGAAIDVLSGEQAMLSTDNIKNNPLVKYAIENDNLLITPHIGGASIDSLQKVEFFMAEKLMNFIRRDKLK